MSEVAPQPTKIVEAEDTAAYTLLLIATPPPKGRESSGREPAVGGLFIGMAQSLSLRGRSFLTGRSVDLEFYHHTSGDKGQCLSHLST